LFFPWNRITFSDTTTLTSTMNPGNSILNPD
jgi:hypothetical protein